jgi:hypothetical protein
MPHQNQATGGRGRLPRVVVACSFALLVTLSAPAARAGDGDDSGPSNWTKFMQFMGLKQSSGPGINYTERAPLVVPPSRDLPPPAESAGLPAADWPKDPNKPHPKSEKLHAEIVPGTAVQTPNPHVEKKPWYNPSGWFDKEEYASFKGEPMRQSLTDPPAGYRVPSPDQPYGIMPEKDKGKNKVSAQDMGYGSVTPQPGK